MMRRVPVFLVAMFAALALALAAALPAWAAGTITMTWVRHAESTANAAGIIDTTVPGPGLTVLGQTQAVAIGEALAAGAYDGIFTSDMIRTQQTAAPLVTDLDITPVVLGGVREINAGIFEGSGGLIGGLGYVLPPIAWILGARFVPVLGGENGNGFDARVDAAVAAIYGSGETDPVVFSHGATIMAWTLMNVVNPDFLLGLTHPLGNTDVVVVNGSPEDGWTLTSWDGITVDPEPGLLAKLFVDVRNLVVAPQTSLYDIGQAMRTGDVPTILAAVRTGVVNVATAVVDFARAVVRDFVDAFTPPVRILPARTVPAPTAVSSLRPQRVSTPVADHRAHRSTPRPAALVGRAPAAERAETAAARGKARAQQRDAS